VTVNRQQLFHPVSKSLAKCFCEFTVKEFQSPTGVSSSCGDAAASSCQNLFDINAS
jgi:hypothetical protein